MTNFRPMSKSDRIDELDVLRGFALMGVFVVHFTSSSFYNLTLTEAQQNAFLANPLDLAALSFAELFFFDKANTLFATLFGMGFWIMLDRLRDRGAPFESIYLRRILILLVIGTINLHLLFPGDVLQKYALLGIALLLLRNLPSWALLFTGLILAVFGPAIADLLVGSTDAAWDQFGETQAAALAEADYWHWVTVMAPANLTVDFVQGAFLGWGLYLFGRFLVGAWIIKQGWIQRSAELLPVMRRLALVALPIGFAIEIAGWAMYLDFIPGPSWLDKLLHTTALPVLVTGYALAVILVFHSRYKSIVVFFTPVGRMALTAYVAHGAVFTFVYLPFGLDLLPVLGPAKSLAFAVALFAAMTWACKAWLARFSMGPLEYLWRWATYGAQPPMRRALVSETKTGLE